MDPSPPSSSSGGLQRHGQFHHTATASTWDSDNVVYVGMEYPNMGACSQRSTGSLNPGNYAGGCSQNKTAVSVDMTSAGTKGGYGLGDANYGVGTSARSSGTLACVLPHPVQPTEPLPSASLSSMAAPAPVFTTREVEGCEKGATSVGDMSPAVLCEDHLRDGMKRVAHNDSIYGKLRSEGITPPTNDSNSSKHKGENRCNTECPLAEHEPASTAPASRNQPEIIPETPRDSQPMSSGPGVVAPSNSKYCQHPGCDKTPLYGPEEGAPPTLCRSHKRAGMFITRDGRTLKSTRDGKGISKTVPSPAEVSEYGALSTEGRARTWPSAAHSRAAAWSMRTVEQESTDPDPSWTSSSSISRLQMMNRKLCEVPGCQVQPSYGPSGSTRPRFCSEHKGKGHVGLKNRPCLFPGCQTRPHYGLTKGRAVYCATHKKDGMVHLLKESIVLEKERAAWNREEVRRKVAERKKKQAAAAAGMANINEDGDDEEWTEESEFGRRSGRGGSSKKKKSRSETRSSGRRGTSRRNKGGWRRKNSSLSPVSSSGSSGRSPSQDTEDKASDGSESNQHCAAAFPLYSQLPDGEGVASVMAPSVEIRLLQQARESAKAAAEASGSGRRARAPSRKLLEASGALENEGAQWMTREIKEADAKAKRELREQRKHFKAAGLKAGEAIEAITETKADGGETTADADIEGGKFDASWRVQTQAAAKQQQSTGEGLAASSNINAKKEAVEAFSPAAVDKPPLKRAWVVSVPDGSARDGKAAKVSADATAPTPKRVKQGHDHHNREGGREAAPEASGNVSAGKPKTAGGGEESKGSADADKGRDDSVDQTKCEFGDCSKTANFGVNGTVRYCKTHRLFGMHEIPQSR